MKKLGIGRTRLVLALGAAVAAAAAVIIVIPATFGSFSDQTTNSGNSASLGTLLVTNSAGGSSCGSGTTALASSTCTALFSVTNLKPGDYFTNSVTLTNGGSLPGIYTMNFSNVHSYACGTTMPPAPVAPPAAGCGGVGTATNLADNLNLWVKDDKGNTIYGTDCVGSTSVTHALSGFSSATTLPPTTAATDNHWLSGEGHTYYFEVCIPGGSTGLGNSFQGTSASFDIVTNGTQTVG